MSTRVGFKGSLELGPDGALVLHLLKGVGVVVALALAGAVAAAPEARHAGLGLRSPLPWH